MSTMHFTFTKEQPNALFGAKVLRFDKLLMSKGEIENLEFLIMWQTKEQRPTGETIVSHSLSFQPFVYVDSDFTPVNSIVHKFRKEFAVPVFPLGVNLGIELVAHHAGGEFDCTLFVEIDPM